MYRPAGRTDKIAEVIDMVWAYHLAHPKKKSFSIEELCNFHKIPYSTGKARSLSGYLGGRGAFLQRDWSTSKPTDYFLNAHNLKIINQLRTGEKHGR